MAVPPPGALGAPAANPAYPQTPIGAPPPGYGPPPYSPPPGGGPPPPWSAPGYGPIPGYPAGRGAAPPPARHQRVRYFFAALLFIFVVIPLTGALIVSLGGNAQLTSTGGPGATATRFNNNGGSSSGAPTPAMSSTTANPLPGGWSSEAIDPYNDSTAALEAVSCPSSSFCMAVDNFGNAIASNGSTWSSLQGIDQHPFFSVSCASSSFCVALDTFGNALTYNGETWSSPVSVDSGIDYFSISCPSSSFCMVVEGSVGYGYARTYNGKVWSSRMQVDQSIGGLYSVSCPSSSFCVALDSAGLAYTFNGQKWNPAGGDGDPIDSFMVENYPVVSCPNLSFCAIVDQTGYALTYNGIKWTSPQSIDPTVEGVSQPGLLSSVSCPSSSFCMAVDLNGSVLTYNGKTWSAPLHIGGSWFGFHSVSCPSSSFCAAVGGLGSRFNDAFIYHGSSSAVTAGPAASAATPRATTATPVPNAPIPAPVLISPANGSSFSNYPRTTTLKWAAVAGAASYNVDIEYYSGGWNVLTMATVASTSYTFDFIGGQPGRWRVQAVGTGGSGGLWSSYWTFAYTV